jgi:histone demethylase JARID1
LLEARQRAGDNWEDRAKNILAQPIKTIDELDDFADMDAGIPIDPGVLDRLMAARAKAKDFDKQAKAWLSPETHASKPRVQEVMRLVNRAEKDFSIISIQDLKRTADIAIDLETRCDQVLRNRYDSTDEDVFETMGQWKTYARDHLRMFSLPTFEKLDTQLKLHYQWLVDLPWYCREHQEAHGQAILDDVLECTNPEDDAPPSDEYFTCICMTPVRPPPQGGVSDAVQCDHCYARFHGLCAKTGGSCPFCDHHHWNGAIHKERNWHFCYLPGILSKAPEITKYYSEDWKQLEIIVHRVDRLSQHIGQFLSYTSQPANQRQGYIHQVRHFMRKLYKLQFAVSPNPEVSFGLDLAGLHRILAGRPPVPRLKKRRRPRFTFGQDIDSDWSDGTRCICRGRTPYLLNYPTVACESCNKSYHAGCVFYPVESPESARFLCPLCCLRKNRPYSYSDVRVKPIGMSYNLSPLLSLIIFLKLMRIMTPRCI